MLDTRNAPVNVYLSAGSNIAPEHYLRMACQALEASYGELHAVIRLSQPDSRF